MNMSNETGTFKSELGPLSKYMSEFFDERVCSCCLIGGRLINMNEIMNCSERMDTYINMINRCFNSEILIVDELPLGHRICSECVGRLADAYKFKCQIIESQKTLLDYFDDNASLPSVEKLNSDEVKSDIGEFDSDYDFGDNADLSDCEQGDIIKARTNRHSSIKNSASKRKKSSIGKLNRTTKSSKLLLKTKSKNAAKPCPLKRPKKETDTKSRKPYMKCEDAKVYAAMDKDNIECKVCSKRFRSLHNLSQHMNDHFVNYTCEICGKGLATSTRFTNHMRRHITGTFKCRICDKMFDTISRLDNHRAKHRSGKHLCHRCKRRFLSFYSLKKHLIKEHGEEANYPCKMCNVVCMTSGLLVVHVRAKHTVRERNFGCEHCDKEFFEKRALKKHMVIHTGLRNYACSECNKAYARKETLNQHMKVHRNIRDYVCSLCGQAFIQKCSLDWHLRKHGYGSGNARRGHNDASKEK